MFRLESFDGTFENDRIEALALFYVFWFFDSARVFAKA